MHAFAVFVRPWSSTSDGVPNAEAVAAKITMLAPITADSSDLGRVTSAYAGVTKLDGLPKSSSVLNSPLRVQARTDLPVRTQYLTTSCPVLPLAPITTTSLFGASAPTPRVIAANAAVPRPAVSSRRVICLLEVGNKARPKARYPCARSIAMLAQTCEHRISCSITLGF